MQHALELIGDLKIDRQELLQQDYGPSTAKAVLNFKQRRAIINRAYQTTADNIVGRMTIAQLDEEMLKRQNTCIPIGECAIGGLALSENRQFFGVTAAASGPITAPQQLGKKLRVVFGITKDTVGPFNLAAQINAANTMLGVHGMSLDVQFGTGAKPDELPTAQGFVIEDDIIEIRKAFETVRPGLQNVLRVIIVKMGVSRFGETFRGKTIDGQIVSPFVFLNCKNRDVSEATLLHEMIHASHKQAQAHDKTPPASVFSENGSENPNSVKRTDLPDVHARELGVAYYS